MEDKASAPPGVPTPICRIEVVSAAISHSLSAKSRRETYFRKNSPPSKCFEVGSFNFSRNISCVLSRKRHSYGKSTVPHVIVRMSRPR